jgi:hypothetical protein
MLAPSGRLSNAITLSCLDPGVALRDGFATGFAFEAFLAALSLDRPRTFFSGFDWAAAIFTERGVSRVGGFFDVSGAPRALTIRGFEEGARAPSLRCGVADCIAGGLLFTGISGVCRIHFRHDPDPAKAQTAAGLKIQTVLPLALTLLSDAVNQAHRIQ